MTLSFPAESGRPTLWSARRTAVAIVAAVGIGSLTAVAVSYADTGSGQLGTGQFQGPSGGQFNGPPFGRRGFGGQLGNGQFGQLGNGQQAGPLQGGQLGSVPSGLPSGP